MASLPEFHAFNKAAADGEGSLGSPVAQAGQVTQQTEAADHGASENSLATSTTQATQATEVPVPKPLGPGVVEVISSELASLRAKATSMSLNPEDPAIGQMLQLISNLERLQSALLDSDSPSSLTHKEASSALAYLRSIACTNPFDSHHPAHVALVGQISHLERQLAEFESSSAPNAVLPIVSIDIIESIFFVTMGIARFIVRSAMPPAALAVGIFMFLYPKAGDLSTITATLLSVVAILATAQVYLVC